MKSLSDTQRIVLGQAGQHAQRLAPLPKLPKAAADAVLKSLLRNGLLAECTAPREHAGRGGRQDEHGGWIALRITATGLRAIGLEPDPVEDTPTTAGDAAPPGAAPETQSDATATPPEADTVTPAAPLGRPAPPTPRRTLRDAAAAVLAAWDDAASRATDMIPALREPMAALRAGLAGNEPTRTPRDPAAAARAPRAGTKQEQVLAMLRRPDGATVAQIAEATGWAAHTVRGFFAGLKKRRGVAVELLERVRQVGPNKEGAKGSYTVYRVTD
jgi:hypothetical protein